jgi:hypothetical protein
VGQTFGHSGSLATKANSFSRYELGCKAVYVGDGELGAGFVSCCAEDLCEKRDDPKTTTTIAMVRNVSCAAFFKCGLSPKRGFESLNKPEASTDSGLIASTTLDAQD